ncbi:MAG TPA: hypothetical protein VLA56_11145 [Pseudomonadales bacterium]|nr:hypothetical protein [Pseudomonadales bacterium]
MIRLLLRKSTVAAACPRPRPCLHVREVRAAHDHSRLSPYAKRDEERCFYRYFSLHGRYPLAAMRRLHAVLSIGDQRTCSCEAIDEGFHPVQRWYRRSLSARNEYGQHGEEEGSRKEESSGEESSREEEGGCQEGGRQEGTGEEGGSEEGTGQEEGRSQEGACQEEGSGEEEGTCQEEGAGEEEGTGEEEGACQEEGTGEEESACQEEGTRQEEGGCQEGACQEGRGKEGTGPKEGSSKEEVTVDCRFGAGPAPRRVERGSIGVLRRYGS